MFAAALILVLTVQLAPATVVATGCPKGFTTVTDPQGTSCLQISTSKADINGAIASCRSQNGELVTGENAWRRANLKSFLQNYVSTSQFIFIGAEENTFTRTFFFRGFVFSNFWDRDDPNRFSEFASQWRKDEPDNSNGNESCVCAKTDGLWNDCKCTDTSRFYICEARP